MTPYAPRDFSSLLGLSGLSDELLKNHFSLYEGYVTNVNKLSAELGELEKKDLLATPAYAEIKRRFGWEWNGMRLHELYFENLTKHSAPLEATVPLSAAIEKQFGNKEVWEKHFRATGAIRGIGWTALVQDRATQKLFITWINEHDLGHLAEAKILLIMDVFEHAFMLDYGIKRADYIDAFMKAIDWKIVEARYLTD